MPFIGRFYIYFSFLTFIDTPTSIQLKLTSIIYNPYPTQVEITHNLNLHWTHPLLT